MCVDPLSQFHSPYIYAGNNPINNIDPNGMYSNGVTYKNGSKGFQEICAEFGIGSNSSEKDYDSNEKERKKMLAASNPMNVLRKELMNLGLVFNNLNKYLTPEYENVFRTKKIVDASGNITTIIIIIIIIIIISSPLRNLSFHQEN